MAGTSKLGLGNPLDPPEGPLPPAGAGLVAPLSGDGGLAELPDVIAGTNPLIAAANPLLNLIPQIRATAQHADPARLRDFLVDQIQAFELRARSEGMPIEVVIGARYCLCTALDETAAQTPWGGSGAWSRHSLLVTFHNETWGGEKFFQLLAKLAQSPQQHAQLLELMYYCLALGFEGRFRIVDNGRTQLETLKQRLAQIIRQNRGEYEPPLALHWKGVPAPAKRAWENLPLWVAASFCGLVALGLYAWLLFSLASQSDGILNAIASLRAPRLPETRPVAPPTPPPPAAPRLKRFLEQEIREGLVFVDDRPDRSIVILRGEGLFDSGSATIKERYESVLTRIANALNEVPGQVLVAGYTDNVPSRSLKFPSNYHLSQARADVVKAFLERRLNVANRMRAEGRAEADPIAPNDSAENRARNRRVEITLFVPPTQGERESPAPAPAQTPAPPGK